ncbi:MAG: hypothetical protein ACE5IL_10780 [Myxococcota bacterium]
MEHPPSLERRLVQLLLGIGGVAVLGVLAIVPYRLYERDIRHASVEASRISSVVHVALSRALLQGGDVTDLVNRFQGIANLELRLTRVAPGEMHPAATSGKGSSRLQGTDLDYVAPPILDHEGNLWLARMHFDLSPMKRASIRLIIDLTLAVIGGSLVFSTVLFLLIRHGLIEPLEELARAIERVEETADPDAIPRFRTREVTRLAEAFRRACRARLGPPGTGGPQET